jgi:alpha/beta superfamily hydrolase
MQPRRAAQVTSMSERLDITVTASEGSGLELEALLGSGERGAAVVAPPHPLYGGELSNPVVAAIAEGLARAGIAALRFNFRGVGRSAGTPSGRAADADADYAAALDGLSVRRAAPYLGAGYSFGAAAALRVAARDLRIARLVLVAPPLAMIDRAALDAFAGPVTVLVGDEDAYAPLAQLERLLAGRDRLALHVLTGEDHFFGTGAGRLSALVAEELLADGRA